MSQTFVVRGTTPTHIFVVDVSLLDISALYITYEQHGKTILEKSLTDDIVLDDEHKTISVKLTQKDTLAFEEASWNWVVPNQNKLENKILVQIRIKYDNGDAIASEKLLLDLEDVLKDGEI